MIQHDYVQAVEGAATQDELAVAYGDMVRVIKENLEVYGNGVKPRISPQYKRSPVVPPQLSDYERERMGAFGACMAWLATKHPEVRRFRCDVLGDERLTREQAGRFLQSPAVAVLSHAQFKDYGIPPLGHTATLIAHEQRQEQHEATLFVHPPGITLTVVSEADAMPVTRSVPVSRWIADLMAQAEAADIIDERERRGRTRPWPNSLLDELRQLGLDLEDRYHWQIRDGAWFILTGQTPPVSPLRAAWTIHQGDHTYGTIDATLAVWASDETLLRAVHGLRAELLGRANHALSMRNLAMLRFVMGRTIDAGRRPPWCTLVADWNAAHTREHTEWTYRRPNGDDDFRRFARDYKRAYDAVVHPCYHYGARTV